MTSLTIDLDNLAAALGDLDDDTLNRLHSGAGTILEAREEAELPATVLESLREALAKDGDTREPLSMRFSTSEYDNGWYWRSSGLVKFADGSTDTVDLDDTAASEALNDHAEWQEGLDGTDGLTVTFKPLAVCMS